jgi:hypothetical protein
MSNIFTRLFGGNNNIIKDPQLGKVRFIESANGNVWAGSFHLESEAHQVDFYIESEEKILKHESRSILIDLLENHEEIDQLIRADINVASISNHRGTQLSIIHIPQLNDDYDAELIYGVDENNISILLNQRNIVEVFPHNKES